MAHPMIALLLPALLAVAQDDEPIPATPYDRVIELEITADDERLNIEAAPKVTMRRPTLPGLGEGCYGSGHIGRRARSASPGWWVTACQQGTTGNTGSPLGWSRRPTDASGIWPKRVAEGPVLLSKPGNSGGGKEPWFQGADGAARDGGD